MSIIFLFLSFLLSLFPLSFLLNVHYNSSFFRYQCTCLWFSGIIFGSYGYLKVAVSDRVAIEKSVGSQLAMPMSLDIRRNSYARLLFQEIYCFKILLAY